jgi:hypothetical protein
MHEATWLVAGGGLGGVIGFLLGLWWCRRCHEKKKGDKGDGPNDR